MFRFRRLPFLPGAFVFIAVGIVLASLAGSAGSAIGAMFILPFLVLKMMFFFFLFSGLMRFGALSRRGRGHGGGRPVENSHDTDEDREWEEARRLAQEEIDQLFPEPQG